MVFTTEEFGDIGDVSSDDIERVLGGDAFGKFAVLAASEGDFIQAGNTWTPSDDCTAFLQLHDSDPWRLEYRDAEAGRLFRANGDVTLEQVKRAFVSYLRGDSGWRRQFEWAALDV